MIRKSVPCSGKWMVANATGGASGVVVASARMKSRAVTDWGSVSCVVGISKAGLRDSPTMTHTGSWSFASATAKIRIESRLGAACSAAIA